jgi:hypothetical protein
MAHKTETVYIIGAGFSAGLGYPTTSNLLIEVWPRLSTGHRERLGRVIGFHQPNFDPERGTSFPYIETLLTQISVNLEMFDSSRIAEGSFTRDDLLDMRAELLTEIAQWFHSLYQEAAKVSWLEKVARRIQNESATVISFNWDLILDYKLFAEVSAANYGLERGASGPRLLKPHGSLNWYEADQIAPVSTGKRIELHAATGTCPAVEAFVPPRHIISKTNRRYTPLIIPPTYIKDFSRPISSRLWKRCTEALSKARRINVLGYSLPEADMQAQFIFRCGFHNQMEGMIKLGGGRTIPTGPSKVTVVNPDSAAARRLEHVAGKHCRFAWRPLKVEDWAKNL